MKRKTNATQGITLIALVITIIVMLILAGVVLSLAIGERGIFNTAQNASKEYEIEEIKEQIRLDILDKQAENEGSISDESLEKILLKYGTLSEEEKILDRTLTLDKGNYEIKVSDIYNGTTVEDGSKNPTFTTVANKPDIDGFDKTKTYYVAWNENTEKTAYNSDEKKMSENVEPDNWYDYTSGTNHWANIKTTGGGNDCYWVWIPRYAYKVPAKGSTAETIEIKFLDKATNIPIGETEAITNTTPTPGTWVVHPAFTNAGNGGFGELTGIWVAKFEASSSNVSETTVASDLTTTGGGDVTNLQVRVKPNVTSWRGITVNNIFTVCRNLTASGNSLEGTSGIDSHMMKNTEWGAVAYLSMSVYGKNGEVWNNPYYNNTTNYSPITGLCGNASNGKDNGTTDITKTCKYNETGGGNASTTGNVYGVYDMAGGAWEYVAGILSSKKSNSTYYDFSSIDTKYYDSYNSYDNTKYGDAVYETSSSSDSGNCSWDSNYSYFPNSSSFPVFHRGGRAGHDSYAGVFAFVRDTGGAVAYGSFRPVVLSSQP